MTKPLCIAIDGPAASGKTVVGRELAKRFGARFLDTGAMYRAVTWAAIKNDVSPYDQEALTRMASMMKFELIHANDGDRLMVDGENITGHLRDAEVDRNVSAVSAVTGVRKALVQQQRQVATQGPIVMVGRDIGTVVLPNAFPKIFLLASNEVRAKRRHLEQKANGLPSDYDRVLEDQVRRDKLDSERDDSPLKPADDAMQIDTDTMTIDEVVQKIESLM